MALTDAWGAAAGSFFAWRGQARRKGLRLAGNAHVTAHARFGIDTNARAVRSAYERMLGLADEDVGSEPLVGVA